MNKKEKMNSHSQLVKLKKKITEVKTFPVPFLLGEIKENISISTDSPSKPSKEEIIKLAFRFHSEGNFLKAAKYYQLYIHQGFNSHIVFSNYGVILKDLGKLNEAKMYLKKAIKIKPNIARYYSNLGNILCDLGDLKEAEILHRKAIKINSNLADAHLNLGNVLTGLGKLNQAKISTLRAIKLKPNFTLAHLNLGTILRDLHKPQEALDSYLKAIEINSGKIDIYNLISQLIRESDPSQFNKSKLKNIINLLLEKHDIPHQELFKAFNFLYIDEIIHNLQKFESDLFNRNSKKLITNDKLISNAFYKIIFKDIRLEKILTKLRKYICIWIAKYKKELNESQSQFTIALAGQCFLNEYIYPVTPEESLSINKIIKRCINREINETNLSIIACYIPLYKLVDQIPLLKSFYSSNPIFRELLIFQISEPLQEIKLCKSITKIGSLNNNISKKVMAQYEKNPYPRWRHGNASKFFKVSVGERINLDIKPNNINSNKGNSHIKVLIAGCGTGQHILNAQQYKNAIITGIDLSLSSLAFAQRKLNELKINNVKLIQMDIFEVGLLEEKFDIIESNGVLHHMNEPSKGLKALLDILKPNGFIQLGLYSEFARQDIIQARDYIKTNNLPATDEGIKTFREDVFSGNIDQISNLVNWGDFYTISGCRDLCFHAKEHRFTIHDLSETLKSHHLEFLGFLLPQPIKSLYESYFSEDKTQTNLLNWAKFEEKNPNTFRGMYQFWACKTQD